MDAPAGSTSLQACSPAGVTARGSTPGNGGERKNVQAYLEELASASVSLAPPSAAEEAEAVGLVRDP